MQEQYARTAKVTAETKEQLGGFWVIRCDDLDQTLFRAEKCAPALAINDTERTFLESRRACLTPDT